MNDHRSDVEEIVIEHITDELDAEAVRNLSDDELFAIAIPLVKAHVSEETRKEMAMEGKNMSRDSLKEYLNVNTFKGKPFSGVIAHFRYALHGKR